MGPPPPPTFIFWLLFHSSRGQNRESRSSVFLWSETKRKRLLHRLARVQTKKQSRKKNDSCTPCLPMFDTGTMSKGRHNLSPEDQGRQ